MKGPPVILLLFALNASADKIAPVCGIKTFQQTWFSTTRPEEKRAAYDYFRESYSSLPETGSATEISTSALNVMTIIALLRCAQEELKGTLDEWIQQKALELWGREADETERLLAKELYYAALEANSDKTPGKKDNHAATLVCALFLASPESWIR